MKLVLPQSEVVRMTSKKHLSRCYTRDHNPLLKGKIASVWSWCHSDAGCHLARNRVKASVNLSVNHLSSTPACSKWLCKDWSWRTQQQQVGQVDLESADSHRSQRGKLLYFYVLLWFFCVLASDLSSKSLPLFASAWFAYGISRSRRRRSSERSRSWRTCEGGPTSSDWWTQSKTQW